MKLEEMLMMMGENEKEWGAIAVAIVVLFVCAMVTCQRLRKFVRWLVHGCLWGNGNRGHDGAAAQAALAAPTAADDQSQEAATATADDRSQETATATADDRSQEAATATADDQIQKQVGVECQGGQEAVAALPARGGITTATEEEEMKRMRRHEKGKQAIVYEKGEGSKSKEEEEEKAKKEQEQEGAERTTLRADVGQGNTSTSVETTVSTTGVSVGGSTGISVGGSTGSSVGARRQSRVTWSQTVTIIRDNEDTAPAAADIPRRANRLSNGYVPHVEYPYATNFSGDGSLANGTSRRHS